MSGFDECGIRDTGSVLTVHNTTALTTNATTRGRANSLAGTSEGTSIVHRTSRLSFVEVGPVHARRVGRDETAISRNIQIDHVNHRDTSGSENASNTVGERRISITRLEATNFNTDSNDDQSRSVNIPIERTDIDRRTSEVDIPITRNGYLNDQFNSTDDRSKTEENQAINSIPGLIEFHGPQKPEYVTVESRLDTYESWPRSLGQKPREMAEAGFYYSGMSDRVFCYHCHVGLWSWESEDKPWEEHAKAAPNCSFLQLVKGRNFVAEHNPTVKHSPAGNALRIRKNSSQILPSEVAKTVSNLPDKKEVEDWEKIKSDNYILRQQKVCKICLDGEVEVVFIPCGHLVSCSMCAPSLTDCAICRTQIKAVVRAYLA